MSVCRVELRELLSLVDTCVCVVVLGIHTVDNARSECGVRMSY